MSSYLAFRDKYSNEHACIQALADLKWPDGFSCEMCAGHKAYHLASRPRLFECAACRHQYSVTAGTIFHKTRTPLRKWFITAYLVAHDKRGVSALYVSRELGIRYDTAWLMCHKIRHALTESRTGFLLQDDVEIGERCYGGGRRTGSRDRAPGGPAIVVCAVERVSTAGTRNKGIKNQGFIAGNARIAVLAHAAGDEIGAFIRSNIKAGATIVSDGLKSDTTTDGNTNRPSAPQGAVAAAGVAQTPIVHTLLSNVRAWLNGTHHGVSIKHLPRYLREWNYRFNRRGRIERLERYLLRRTASRRTVTYAELVAGRLADGAASV